MNLRISVFITRHENHTIEQYKNRSMACLTLPYTFNNLESGKISGGKNLFVTTCFSILSRSFCENFPHSKKIQRRNIIFNIRGFPCNVPFSCIL
jgi:hypothetical protein